MSWLENATKNLLDKSIEKHDFKKATDEWFFNGVQDNDNLDSECELCNHTEICYQFFIKNRFNENTLAIGSTCINKFIGNDDVVLVSEDGTTVTSSTLKKQQLIVEHDIINDWLLVNFTDTDYQKNMSDRIINDEQISINQAKYLGRLLAIINNMDDFNKAKYNSALRDIIKFKSFRSTKQKMQLAKLEPQFYSTIYTLMSAQQRKKYYSQGLSAGPINVI